MPYVYPSTETLRSGFAKPIVQALFWASCLLSVVSFYTTQQGMALYLSPWFSFIAALGIQISLVMVAWLIGFTRRSRVLLIVVYVITAIVSIAFSYVTLYTWFSAKERPAVMQRNLFDQLMASSAKSEQTIAEAVSQGKRLVTALDEMTATEKTHGHISKARDADPYLDRVRDAVAKEAQSYDLRYREGSGEGIRYTAFERHTKLTRQTVDELEAARQNLMRLRAELKPAMNTEDQLKRYHAAADSIPWASAEQVLSRKLDRPLAPSLGEYVEQSGSGQEELMRSFEELVANPGSRNAFCLALAAFIDIIIFLLAYASGPYFYGDPEQRWWAASAAVDGVEPQIFVRDLLRKMRPGRQGMPRLDADGLTPGEQQFGLLLVEKRLATVHEEDGRNYYLFDADIHEKLLDSIAHPGIGLRSAQRSAAGA